MKEFFFEESCECQNAKSESKKYTIFNILSYVFFLAFITVTVYFIWYIPEIIEDVKNGGLFTVIIYVAILGILFGSAFLFNRLKKKFNASYDYTIVSGSLRISSIHNNSKRYNELITEYSYIEKVGKVGSETFNQYSKLPNIKKKVYTSNNEPAENKHFFYIVLNENSQKKLIVLECTEQFIVNLLTYSNKRVVLEKDYK